MDELWKAEPKDDRDLRRQIQDHVLIHKEPLGLADRPLARSYTVNGSLIGATPYSLSYGYEDPAQAYFLVHSKYGIVGQRPLFVDI